MQLNWFLTVGGYYARKLCKRNLLDVCYRNSGNSIIKFGLVGSTFCSCYEQFKKMIGDCCLFRRLTTV